MLYLAGYALFLALLQRCYAGRLHNSLPYGSRSSHSCSTRRSLRIEDRMLPARHGFEPTSSTMTCPAFPPFLFYFDSTIRPNEASDSDFTIGFFTMLCFGRVSAALLGAYTSTDFASKQSRHLNASYQFGACHAYKHEVWHTMQD